MKKGLKEKGGVPKVWMAQGGVTKRAWYHGLLGLSCPFCCLGEVDNEVGDRCVCGAEVVRTEEDPGDYRRVAVRREMERKYARGELRRPW